MEQREQSLERVESGRRGVGVLRVQSGLDRLGVPVAEIVEGEVVERVDRRREAVLTEAALDLLAHAVDTPQNPPLERLARSGFQRRASCVQHEARDIPELDREPPALLDRYR